ncbi:MAG: alpha-amylase family glycosyl hydrolase [Bacteroidota bacterium]
MKQNLILLAFLALFPVVSGQVIRTEPVFPTQNDSVRIIFDASQGNAGLAGYTADIWAHTGVITDKSISGTDWKYVVATWSTNLDKAKMTSLGNNLWELKVGPSIRSYYGVPGNEIILKMAFVFRNSSGSRQGKMQDGSDIFTNVYEAGLNLTITSPDKEFLAVESGSVISIMADAISTDSIALFQDSARLFSQTGTSLTYNLTAAPNGFHQVEVWGYGQGQVVTDSFSYLIKGGGQTAELPAGVKDGINYQGTNQVTLVLYAPGKEFVFTLGDFNNWETDPDYQMKKTPDGKRFWITLDGLEPMKEYIFQYLVDGEIRIGDPYAEKISDPWNDQYITRETYPDMLSYPTGKTTQTAAVFQTGKTPYIWKNSAFTPPPKDKLIIYELLLRDFLSNHTFLQLIDTLDYLADLGITAIELMPVNEFEGNESWGYNPSFYFAIDKYYGPGYNFKAFVDSAHQKGLAVIMDMVLNHSYGQSPMVRMYWDAVNSRPSADNPWYNAVSPNSTYSWGYDFNHESEATKRFVDSVNTYWLSEFKVDGFRFDFTKGFTNATGEGSAYDASRIAILKRMADKIWQVNSGAYIILEHFTANTEEMELADDGMMLWGDSNYNYRYAASGWPSGSSWNFSGISALNRGWSDPGLVGYMESHDEERLMYDCVRSGNTQNQSYNLKDTLIALKRMELAANFFIPVPGPKMIWMFGELGYDYTINFNGRVGNKPIRWDYYENSQRKRLYQVYSALNALKSQFDTFATTDYQTAFQDTVKRLHLNYPEMNVTVLGNFGIRSSAADPHFQHNGWWYEYWSGDSVEVEDPDTILSLNPGEYRFYTDVRLEKPDIISGMDPETFDADQDHVLVFPNPASDQICLLPGEAWGNEIIISITDIYGRLVAEDLSSGLWSGQEITLDISQLTSGIYFIRIDSGNQRTVRKFVKE